LAETLATAVHDLVDLNVSGIYNVVGDERLSKYEFGQNLAKEFSFEFSRAKKARLSDQNSEVLRPSDMSLSNRKVCDLLGRQLGVTTDHLTRLRQQKVESFTQEILRL
jgi:dTDP-4-dehydrorhamnose reductase